MKLDLEGKTAVVSGASRGIGLATVKVLIDEGVRVVGAARTITRELEATGAGAFSADLSTADGAAALMEYAIAELGGVDLLVNNVGGSAPVDLAGFLDVSDQRWAEMFELNFFSALRTTRAAMASLIERRGAIVNVSSINSKLPAAAPVTYSAAKAALTALGKSLAEEFGARGVRVNTVSPGAVRTAIWEDPEGFGGKVALSAGIDHATFFQQIPEAFGMTTGRITEPEEVASLIAFLLSDVAGNITGADYVIDGGTIKSL
jgi:NAD(P)-dependent dehydrogenase (short-subunit alcohol dehydrogenase family)